MAKRSSNDALDPRMSFLVDFLKRKNLKGIISLSNAFTPRLIGGFLPKLSDRQRKAFDKAMPKGGKKQFYFHIQGTPTPPIVVSLAQPLFVGVMTEEQVKAEGIKGLKVPVDDIPALVASASGSGDIFAALKGLKGQTAAVLSLMSTFTPFISLGPAEIKDLQARAMKHFKPILDMMPR
ncbi:MAG: hypothetical protein FWG23_06755 [Eggerthellaceae bacterium]|nr:hypothetical protein [Eggerthellaceae bacterium]MDR2715617.1 hypothetical protein [Coriobacteriaceae bacterium]